jgi:integrase
MDLLQHGVDRSVIALWLGHESVETTQMYLHAEKDKVPLYIRNPELDELLLFRVLEELSHALSYTFDSLR